jgi:lipopolysaccharide transport system permease protein
MQPETINPSEADAAQVQGGAATTRFVTEIKPRNGWISVDFAELWRYRTLLSIFVWRDLKVRYKQTMLGVVWLVLQPLAMTVVYSIFFGYIARVPSEGVPYPVFVLSGIVVWQFFSRAVNEGSTSLAAQQALIGKIYFPRLIAPLTSMAGAFVDFMIMFVVLLLAMAYFGALPTWRIAFMPFFLLGLGGFALAISLVLAGLDAIFRDVRYALGFVMQVWYFCSPVIYPVELVPERFQTLYLLNPTTPLVQGFRWSILNGPVMPPLWSIALSAVVTLVALLVGLAVFQRMERNVVDKI